MEETENSAWKEVEISSYRLKKARKYGSLLQCVEFVCCPERVPGQWWEKPVL